MRFSASLPLLRDLSSRDPYRDTFRLAEVAEEAGFDTMTVGHHHFKQGDPADPLTMMGSIATRTSRLRVGTGIFILPLYNPLLVAEQVATIDQMSGGRISLGVGTGWDRFEYGALGVPFHERGERMEEALKVLRLAWTQENTGFEGKHFKFPELTVFPRPVQKPSPPLWVAGLKPKTIDRAARLGDAWLCSPVESLGDAKRLLGHYQQSCAALDKKPEWILRRYGWIKPTRKEVEDTILPTYVKGIVHHLIDSSGEPGLAAPDNAALIERLRAGETIPPAEIARNRLIWGSPDDAIEQIRTYRAETGCEHIHVGFGMGIPANNVDKSSIGDFEEISAMLRLYGREVISAFRGQ